MGAWKPLAALAVFLASAMVGGAIVRLLGVVDVPAGAISLGFVAVAVVVAILLATRSRPLETPYW